MADHRIRTSTVDDEKADASVIEHSLNPYRGLSQDDADFMRNYEGKAGQRVVRKVSLDRDSRQRNFVLKSHFYRSISASSPLWVFCTFFPI